MCVSCRKPMMMNTRLTKISWNVVNLDECNSWSSEVLIDHQPTVSTLQFFYRHCCSSTGFIIYFVNSVLLSTNCLCDEEVTVVHFGIPCGTFSGFYLFFYMFWYGLLFTSMSSILLRKCWVRHIDRYLGIRVLHWEINWVLRKILPPCYDETG